MQTGCLRATRGKAAKLREMNVAKYMFYIAAASYVFLQERAKKVAASDAWRSGHTKEQRKKRYVETGQAEKRAAKKARHAE